MHNSFSQKKGTKNAIALLITLLFIMLISVAITTGLKNYKQAKTQLQKDTLILQSSAILEDFLTLFETLTKEMKIDNSQTLALFLDEIALIPLSVEDMKVLIQAKSARSKININTFNTEIKQKVLEEYFTKKGIYSDYLDMIQDIITKDKKSLKTDIFEKKPTLFREYFTSKEHLLELNEVYVEQYRDDNVNKLPIEELFSFSQPIVIKTSSSKKTLKKGEVNTSAKKYTLDLNYVSAELLSLLLETQRTRAEEILQNVMSCDKVEEIPLTPLEFSRLKRFDVSCFEPFIEIEVLVSQNDTLLRLRFEYDLKLHKGYNFVLEVA